MSLIDTYVSWCFFIAMAAPVIFVILYAYTPPGSIPWYKSWEGRVIMLKQALFVGFLANGVLYFTLGPDWPGRDIVRILLFTVLPIALWSLLVLLIVRRRQGKKLIKESNAGS